MIHEKKKVNIIADNMKINMLHHIINGFEYSMTGRAFPNGINVNKQNKDGIRIIRWKL